MEGEEQEKEKKSERTSELYCLHQVAASDGIVDVGLTTLGSNVVNFCFN